MDCSNIVIPFDFPFAILENRHNPDENNKLVYAVADGQYTYGPLSLFQYHNDEKYAKTIREEELPMSLPCKEFYIVESGFSTTDAIEINDENRGQIFVKEFIPIDDDNDESIGTIDQESEQVQMKTLFKEMTQCKNEIRSLKSIVLSENRFKRRSTSTDSPESSSKWIRGGGGSVHRSISNGHMSDDGGVSTPLRYGKTTGIRKPQQVQSTIVQRSVSSNLSSHRNPVTPLRGKTSFSSSSLSSAAAVTSKYATPMRTTVTSTKKVVLKNIKSSGYGQFSATNNTTTTIKKQQQQQLATLATPGRSFRK